MRDDVARADERSMTIYAIGSYLVLIAEATEGFANDLEVSFDGGLLLKIGQVGLVVNTRDGLCDENSSSPDLKQRSYGPRVHVYRRSHSGCVRRLWRSFGSRSHVLGRR